MLRKLSKIRKLPNELAQIKRSLDYVRQALGRVEERQLADKVSSDLNDYEFRVYSQWGEDGIIQKLVRDIKPEKKIFVEFGVQDYLESNTRHLLTHNNWAGVILDGGEHYIRSIKQDPIYWRYNLKAVEAFITAENINQLFEDNGVSGEIGLLSIDIDGNDYWVWKALECVSPAIVVVEYNFQLGAERSVTVEYKPDFQRHQVFYSGAYMGASLAALHKLGKSKGYSLVGCNGAGNNAFFVKEPLRPKHFPALSPAQAYHSAQFREGRNELGQLTYEQPVCDTDDFKRLPWVEV